MADNMRNPTCGKYYTPPECPGDHAGNNNNGSAPIQSPSLMIPAYRSLNEDSMAKDAGIVVPEFEICPFCNNSPPVPYQCAYCGRIGTYG